MHFTISIGNLQNVCTHTYTHTCTYTHFLKYAIYQTVETIRQPIMTVQLREVSLYHYIYYIHYFPVDYKEDHHHHASQLQIYFPRQLQIHLASSNATQIKSRIHKKTEERDFPSMILNTVGIEIRNLIHQSNCEVTYRQFSAWCWHF